MKQTIIILIILSNIIFVSCLFYEKRDKVEQGFLSGSFWTWVWVDGQIAQSWNTPTDLLTDSLRTAQKIKGEEILKKIKELK